jgi:diguanylate cyclase (GGDEF)-like protein
VLVPGRRALSRWLVTAAALAAVLTIGGVDAWDSPAIRLGTVYILPVLAASAWAIRHAGVLVAVTSVVVDAAASLAQGVTDPRVLLVMGLLRLGVYLTCWGLVSTLQRDREHLRDLATTDYATAVYNLRGLTEQAAPVIERCARSGQPVSVLFLDVNDFKTINDRYGHAAGDTVLQVIGRQLRLAVRGHDLVARVGGDEFAVLLPGTDEAGALAVAANVASHLHDLVPPVPLPDGFRLGASIGHVTRRGDLPGLPRLLILADEAMYRAKLQHGDRPRLVPPLAAAAPSPAAEALGAGAH